MSSDRFLQLTTIIQSFSLPITQAQYNNQPTVRTIKLAQLKSHMNTLPSAATAGISMDCSKANFQTLASWMALAFPAC